MSMKIIVNCGPCEQWIEKSICSIMSQSRQDWEAFITVDPCGDRTFILASAIAAADHRIHVKENSRRYFSLSNQVNAIRECSARAEDVIVSLDGDDWFSRNDALQIIADAYAAHDCWMTYGSWKSKPGSPYGEGAWPAYPENTVDFRHHRWLGTAVRTWKKWLFDCLRDTDLRDENGEYFRVAEDRAIMFPLLEMCGTERARHIPETIMEYNQDSAHPDASITGECLRNVNVIAQRQTYLRRFDQCCWHPRRYCAGPVASATLATA